MVHSIELLFDPDTESAIRAVWQQLSDAGLRSPPQTSRPHVTTVVADRIAPDVDRLLAPVNAHFPMPAVVGAPMVFGRSPLILVRAVLPSAELLAVHATALAACAQHAVPGPAGNTLTGRWSPHVTLARRVQPSQLEQVLRKRAVSREIDATVVGVRRWDGDKRVEHLIT
ncbi:MAG TPA: 2'-5' RNA ligase family protein [Mycobacterium sp.]|jgi:2'-5' RNA ligase